MAGLIRNEDIAAVRDAVRLEDIVGEYVTLKPAGIDSLKGLCPFHDERTPSFHVRPRAGYWHCFGCGEGGDAIAFVQKINQMSFTEAVEMLAEKVGVTLHYEEGGRKLRKEEPGRRQRLLEAHSVAEQYFLTQLNTPEAHIGRTFLAQRGFTPAMCRHFNVGYAPDGWHHLLDHLRSRGFTDAEIKIAGLASEGSRGLYDRFRGRLVWPIRDITGATVGFGARRLDDNEESPKYLNTPETPIYKKSQLLYGLDLAKKDIAKHRKVVIVEGYTDVMAAHVAGVTFAVATCGTAFGEEHVRMVRRLIGDVASPAAGVVLTDGRGHGGEVIFTFDGDAAGQKAAFRAFQEDQNFAAQTFVAVESSGMDPCELRMAKGDQAVRALVDGRTPLFKFVIKSVLKDLDLNSAEGRVQGLRLGAPVVADIKDRALRHEYTRTLAGWLGMPVEDVVREMRASRSSARGRRQAEAKPIRPGGTPMARAGRPAPRQRRNSEGPVERSERWALQAVLQRPGDVVGAGFDDLSAQAFTVPSFRAVHDAIRAVGGVQGFSSMLKTAEEALGVGEQALSQASRNFEEAVRQSGGAILEQLITELIVAPIPQVNDDPERVRAWARSMVAAIARLDLTRRTANLQAQVQRMAPDDPHYEETFRELMKLEEKRRTVMPVDQSAY